MVQYARSRAIAVALPPEVQAKLEMSQKFYLYSIQPDRLPEADLRTMPNFHGYPIIGQTRVRATPQRKDLLTAVRVGLGKRSALGGFVPKYGLRALCGKKNVDLLIAFECEQMQIYDDRGMHQITVEASSQEVFNRILAEMDVPLPEKTPSTPP